MKDNSNNFAIASLILGIVSVVFAFLYVGVPAGVVGIVLAVKGRKSTEKKGMATAGLVLSIIGVALGGIVVVCAICALGALGSATSIIDSLNY